VTAVGKKREWESGKILNVKLLVFIVIAVFCLIIVIFVIFSLFDKHYTRLEVKSQTNFWKLVNIFFDRINRILKG